MTAITVIVPSYNRSSLLEKTLRSLASQSSRDFQVILVDHSSTDNTREVFDAYCEALPISYHRLARVGNSPGAPRDFGVRKALTPLVAFLDCGMVVPPFYVDAHIAFHQKHYHHVGVGLQFAHHPKSSQDQAWLEDSDHSDIQAGSALFLQGIDLGDEREGLRFADLSLPWMYGWTGNLSMRVDNYLEVGGFDPDQEYGFEDLDLSYRLFRHGAHFDIVEGGWGVDLPHPRMGLSDLQHLEYMGWLCSYRKHRSLALEVAQYAGMNPRQAEDAYRYIAMLGQEYACLDVTLRMASRQFSAPSLLIGGSVRDTSLCDYIALADERITSTSSLWSCSGVFIPLDDHSLQTAIVSDTWKWLGCSFRDDGMTLLEQLIAEIARTTRQAFFLDASSISASNCDGKVSNTSLGDLCRTHNLSFQLIASA